MLADELMRQASAQQDTIAMALAHRDYGTIASTRRDNHAAVEHYRRAIALYATSSDTVAMRGMAATMHNMGVIHMRRARWTLRCHCIGGPWRWTNVSATTMD
ncbi:MAG: hypothetical protein IPG10_20745 [Flavobacteriales bacterium]|nr:hypothetical protein [Flavobacteriales bacterium]